MSRPSERRRRKQNLIGGVLIVGAVAVAIGLGVLRWSFGQQIVKVDQRLCPRDGPRGYVSLLFDVSDPLRPVQQEALRKELLDIEKATPTYHLVQAYVIQPSSLAGLPAPSFEKCKPPIEGSAWTSNVDKRRERYREDFLEPLEQRLAVVSQAPPTHDSPILELIQAAAVHGFPGHASTVPRTIVVVSDFLQHTSAYSHYGSRSPRFEDFKKLAIARTLHTDLSGVEVTMLYLFRDGQERVQGVDHVEFWKQVFAWSGVSAGGLRVVPIEGSGPSTAPVAASERR